MVRTKWRAHDGVNRTIAPTPERKNHMKGGSARACVVSTRARGLADRARLAPWQVKIAQDFMLRKTNSVVPLAEIADRLDLSVNHFIKAFANTVGVAPYHWFVRQRIARAASLLETETMSLAQIAIECGFSDQSHFTRSFSGTYGMTPGRWRCTVKRAQ